MRVLHLLRDFFSPGCREHPDIQSKNGLVTFFRRQVYQVWAVNVRPVEEVTVTKGTNVAENVPLCEKLLESTAGLEWSVLKRYFHVTNTGSVLPWARQHTASRFYLCFRIKIEEEYAKNLSKLSQSPLALQEEGWVLRDRTCKTARLVREKEPFLQVGASKIDFTLVFDALITGCCHQLNSGFSVRKATEIFEQISKLDSRDDPRLEKHFDFFPSLKNRFQPSSVQIQVSKTPYQHFSIY